MPFGGLRSNQPVTVQEAFTLRAVPWPYQDPDTVALMRALDEDLAAIYGTVDREPVDQGDFTPPDGLFLVGYDASSPVACGGFRLRRDVRPEGLDAEIKRMFVANAARGRGFGGRILGALEERARKAGATRAILETGIKSVAAYAMYESKNFQVIPPFSSVYAHSLTNRGMAKDLV